jgi:hypothetical protein
MEKMMWKSMKMAIFGSARMGTVHPPRPQGAAAIRVRTQERRMGTRKKTTPIIPRMGI